ncbi:MAG: serine protease [Prevotella sp.]|nr:serine protease [Prevotella sp.]
MRIIATFLLLLATQLQMVAQPAAVKNAAKSVFTLTAFNKDGDITGSSHGVFIDNEGTAISDWMVFDGADHAIVIDANGKKMEVDYIFGANEIYDVAKFHVKGKTVGAPLATSNAAAGSTIYLVGYALKNAEVKEAKVKSVETFMEKYAYYLIDIDAPDNTMHCPFVNAQGQVVGLMQMSKLNYQINATSANYATDFTVSGLTVNDPTLRRTSIPTAIADGEEQAKIGLLLAGQTADSTKYAGMIENFIAKFPDLPDGYSTRAQMEMAYNDFAGAARDMETCIKKSTEKDDAHYTYSRIIYQKEVYKSDMPYAPWSFDKALEQIRQAYTINPLPLYKHQEAQILYSKGEYNQAHDIFLDLTKSEMRNPELFFEAAQCKTMLKASNEERLALLDSAIVMFEKPYPSGAAPYFIARANILEDMGQYRKAVADYNQYDTLMLGRHNADFYYKREQCEVKGKLFQQALIDIEIATRISQDPLYVAEKASLLLRVNMKQEALETAEYCVAMDPEYPDAYLVKGLAQIQLGNKKEGLETLAKAKELGNEQAEALIEKYK